MEKRAFGLDLGLNGFEWVVSKQVSRRQYHALLNAPKTLKIENTLDKTKYQKPKITRKP